MLLAEIGVNKQKEKQFAAKNIFTVEDLVHFYPRKYKDFSKETGILPETEISCIHVKLNSIKPNLTSRIPLLKAYCTIPDTDELVSVTWFHQNYLLDKYRCFVGRDFLLAGKIKYDEEYSRYEVTSPDLFEPNISASKKIYPVYSKIAGMSADYLADKMQHALEISSLFTETLPYETVGKLGLPFMRDTIYNLHCPQTMEQIEAAQKRIIFDDLTYFALYQEWTKRHAMQKSAFTSVSHELIEKIKSGLPYTLTGDQEKAVDGILQDVSEGNRLNALIQGDVGCGKSIVAFLTMAAFAGAGYQTVIMAPTQIPAKQHYEELSNLMQPLGYDVVYLASGMKAAEKKEALEKIASGDALFIVGTHSVIGKSVEYKNLALTVADEEHRFGVAQRAALSAKAEDGVHSITMSATPIPRSLAQVLYGNAVQLFTIETMPAGRVPVQTGIAISRERIYRFLTVEILKNKHQAYVVCPMIEQSEKMENVSSVEEISEQYKEALEPYGIRIETLTGHDNKERTDEVTAKFKNGEVDILIATTVVEVGINVPNATAMIISSADRFGLSTLHQLRGRVGRSSFASYCVLECDDVSEKARERLQTLCNTTSGFEIAKSDLKMRGAGDFIGTKQSGSNHYLELMIAFPNEYKKAQEVAAELLDTGNKCPLVERVEREMSEQEALAETTA